MSLWKIWRPIRQFQRYDDEQYCPTPDPSAKPDLPPNGESIEKAEQGDPYLVSFDDTPHLSARNWDVWYKVRVVAQLVLITIQVTMASAISSSAVDGQVQEFAIAQEVSELSTAVFLAGFACGAVPFAPLSEAVGRQVVYVVTLLISSLFEFGAAAATNVQTLIICRAFAGFFGATPLSNAGGSLNDLFDPAHRSYAFPMFAAAGFLGPNGAPVIGGYLAMNVSWRWVYWLSAITGCAVALFCFVFTPETLGDEILRHKAAALRKRTGDERWHAPKETIPFKELYKTALTKPFIMLKDPIVFILTAYLSVVYFLLFGWLSAYPVIFSRIHGLNLGENGLCFIPICVGIISGGMIALLFGKRYQQQTEALGHYPPAEERLLPLLLGGALLPPSLFWLGFTSYEFISFWAPVMSGLPFGIAATLIFIGTYQTLIDSYGPNAASSLAAVTFVRYWVSAGTAMATTPMFVTMRPWGACLLLALVSIPLFLSGCLIYRKGAKLRQRSKFAVQGP